MNLISQQQATPTSLMHRALTAAMLSCFALSGWLWLQESSPNHDRATAAVPRPLGSGLAANSTRSLVPSTRPLPNGRGTVDSNSSSASDDEPVRSTAKPHYVTKNIEDIQLGQRLVGRNPLRHETSAPSDIDPAHWRAIRLTMLQSGAFYELAFLRSLEWLDKSDAKVGQHIELALPEMGLLGPARIESIEPCPTIEPDDGLDRMIVTGTMKHLATNVLELAITGLDEPLGVTTTHPIWSEDRQSFLPAAQLTEGEHLRQANGQQTQLTRITPKRGPPELVYNLEVDAEHVYHVAATGLLVHNQCISATSSSLNAFDYEHVFSKQHIRNGIDSLGSSRAAIQENVANAISKANSQRLLQVGSNQIETLMNGLPATIRAQVSPDGVITKINLFPGTSGRQLGNLIPL